MITISIVGAKDLRKNWASSGAERPRGALLRGQKLLAAMALVIGASVMMATSAAAVTMVTPDQGPVSGGTRVSVEAPAFTKIETGQFHSLALASDGTVWAWGDNSFGQLGDGSTTNSSVPVRVNGAIWGTRSITQINTGQFHSVAVASDGTVWAWGYNDYGQLGNGSTTASALPVQVNGSSWGARTITEISAGEALSVALASDGTVWAWGYNDYGQLGNGSTTDSSLPVQVSEAPWGARTITGIGAGIIHVVALASDGTVWAWGDNSDGQLGNGSTTASAVPVPVDGSPWGARTITQVSAGLPHSSALASDGTVWTWGDNSFGQLGIGSTTNSSVPVQANGAIWASRTITQISAGTDFMLVVASDGTVWAWGDNGSQQLGDGSLGFYYSLPVQTDGAPWGTRTIAQVSAGIGHSLAFASDGTVWAWGGNYDGNFGDGSTTSSLVPIRSGWSVNSVSFGGTAGTDPVDNGDGTVSVTTPAHAAGAVEVVVGTHFQNDAEGPSFPTAAGFTYTAPIAAPVITTMTLPDAVVSTEYSTTLTATGEGPIIWALTGGTLPAGINFNPTTAVISGTTTAVGIFTFTVSATNAGGLDTRVFTLAATSAPVVPPATPPSSSGELASTGSQGLQPLWLSITAILIGAGLYGTRKITVGRYGR